MKIQMIKDANRSNDYNILAGSIEVEKGVLHNDTVLPVQIVDDMIVISHNERSIGNVDIDTLGNMLQQSIWNKNAMIPTQNEKYNGEILVRKSNIPCNEGNENFIFIGMTNKNNDDHTVFYQDTQGMSYRNIFFAHTYTKDFDNIGIGNIADAWFTSTFNWGFGPEPLQLYSTLNLDLLELSKEINLLRSKEFLSSEDISRINEINGMTDGVFRNNDDMFIKYLQKASQQSPYFNNVEPITREQYDMRDEVTKNILTTLMEEEQNTFSM